MPFDLTEFAYLLRAVAGLAQAGAYTAAAAAIMRGDPNSLKRAYTLLGLVHVIGAVVELVLALP